MIQPSLQHNQQKPTQIRIHVLGSLLIYLDDTVLTTLRNQKALALLIYLASHRGQLFSRTHLQGLLWSETAATQARNNLRQTLLKLQRAMPKETILLEGLQIGIHPASGYWIDSEHVVDDETLYRGEFLQGFAIRGAALWEEWVYLQRERLATELVQQWETSAENALTNKNYPTALRYLQRILELAPWAERIHRRIMELFLLQADRTAALAQYETLTKLLADELGVEPVEETRRLYQRALRQDAIGALHNLPATEALTEFIGRTDEIVMMGDLLTQPKTRLLTLTGLGGMGKTRLALVVARQQISQFADGVWFVDLTDMTTIQLVPKIANVLNTTLRGHENAEQNLLEHLRDQHLLLILDNFESLLIKADERRAALQLIQKLLQSAPSVKLLVTSRERLNLQTEWVVALNGLHQAGEHLFVSHAQRLASWRVISAEDRIHITTICTLLEGMPLAIELAASWTRLLPISAIAQELNDNIALLETSNVDVPLRQRSLSLILEQTYAGLTVNEQQIMGCLALFHGSFSRDAVETIAGATLFNLMTLVDKGLLYPAGDQRFRLHASLRQFLRGILYQSPTFPAVQRRFSAYFLQQLQDAPLFDSQQQMTIGRLDQDRENLLAAWEWAIENERVDGLLSAEKSLFYFYRIPERWVELFDIFTNAVDKVTQWIMPNPQLLAKLRLRLAAACVERGLYVKDAAVLLALVADEVNSAESDAQGLMRQLQGSIAQLKGDYAAAAAHFEYALTLYEAASCHYEAGYCQSYLGFLGFQSQQYVAAKRAYEQTIATYQDVDDQSSVALMLHNLAYVEEKLGNHIRANTLMTECLRLFAETQSLHRLYISVESLNIFVSDSSLPLPADFEQHLHQWLARAKTTGDGLSEVYATVRLGSLAWRNGDMQSAYGYFVQALTKGRQLNLKWAVDLIESYLPIMETMLAGNR